ncbi:endonuclease/exonuclease/phosphatase family metal-dependent hydrolase [Paenibacillus peoriae]|uniref:Endonuclease/exonuclease/phosphatase family metal-dependent hydrolase n=1 Tax=Paenibacillus peoriae TaxID=59893 RepID=A0ABU1QQQ4_9BACL|nr:endonuclease/exonuclease/phosphatase family protein [Paenibacillus peoriae]MDR6781145.1 endonuclease/exonuclease/phosphatase family metal-dependent hydrolase [Paenibacillus peoriae]
MLRLASYNVENLFERAKILNHTEWVNGIDSETRLVSGRDVLDGFAKLNALLAHPIYSSSDKVEIVRLMESLGLKESDESKFVLLRRNRGTFVTRKNGALNVVANGREDWIGWLELTTEAVNERATQNTARVIRNVDAQIMVVVEAEHRPSLVRFNEQTLGPIADWRFDHVLLIDGNDARGIDVGLFTRAPYAIDFMRSHVDEMVNGKRVFSRDCAEFHITLPDGRNLAILANHFKSKGNGRPADNDALRNKQAKRVREIYEGLRASNVELIAVMGDLNDSPDRDTLSPLLREGSDLKDASEIEGFDFAGRPGTWGDGEAKDKIDYILMSPALFQLARGGGIYRAGVWGGRNGTLFPHLPEIENAAQAASDHAAIYVDLDF